MAYRSEQTLRSKDVKLHYARMEFRSEEIETKNPELQTQADLNVTCRIRFHVVRTLFFVLEMAGSHAFRTFPKIVTPSRSGYQPGNRFARG